MAGPAIYDLPDDWHAKVQVAPKAAFADDVDDRTGSEGTGASGADELRALPGHLVDGAGSASIPHFLS